VYGIVNAASMNKSVTGDHVHAADDVRATLPPLHIVVTEGVRVGAGGKGLTVTIVVAVVVQVPPPTAGPQAENTYAPLTVGEMVGLSSVEVKPEGPLHDQPVPEVVAVSETVPAGQTAPLVEGVAVTVQVDQRKILPSAGNNVWVE
jgi:hypothetical protein